MDGCLFCRIAAGEIPARVVYADDDIVAFHDIAPRAPVHVLVIPRRHVPSLAAAGTEDGATLAALLGTAAEIARRLGVAEDGYRVVTNCGTAGGQTVPHLHFHVLGGRPMGWPPG